MLCARDERERVTAASGVVALCASDDGGNGTQSMTGVEREGHFVEEQDDKERAVLG